MPKRAVLCNHAVHGTQRFVQSSRWWCCCRYRETCNPLIACGQSDMSTNVFVYQSTIAVFLYNQKWLICKNTRVLLARVLSFAWASWCYFTAYQQQQYLGTKNNKNVAHITFLVRLKSAAKHLLNVVDTMMYATTKICSCNNERWRYCWSDGHLRRSGTAATEKDPGPLCRLVYAMQSVCDTSPAVVRVATLISGDEKHTRSMNIIVLCRDWFRLSCMCYWSR